MKLYVHPLSGHSHRAQLFLSLAGVPHEAIEVDLLAGAHKEPEFLAKNAFGQVPVLDDDGTFIADSNAILVYVAKKRGLESWYPNDAKGAASVQRWLSVAAGEVAYGPAAARLVTVFGSSHDADVVIKRAHDLFANAENHLEGRKWLASEEAPTLADVAFYSYTKQAPEGNVDLAAYPRIQALLHSIEQLPGFVPFKETAAGLRS
jgi:glutathione S-transferase